MGLLSETDPLRNQSSVQVNPIVRRKKMKEVASLMLVFCPVILVVFFGDRLRRRNFCCYLGLMFTLTSVCEYAGVTLFDLPIFAGRFDTRKIFGAAASQITVLGIVAGLCLFALAPIERKLRNRKQEKVHFGGTRQ